MPQVSPKCYQCYLDAAVLRFVPTLLQDLLDSDALLDEDDLKKPDPASLKASSCGEGAGKKKKACKNWWVPPGCFKKPFVIIFQFSQQAVGEKSL